MASKLSLTPEILDRFVTFCQKPGNGVGGCLHLFVDDEMDMTDIRIRELLDFTRQVGDPEAEELVQILLHLSRTQRLKLAYRIQDRIYV